MRLKLLPTSLGALLLAAAACDLDRTNPNAPTQETTLSSADGLISVAVGMQNRFASSTSNFIYAAGSVTEEFGAGSGAFESLSQAEVGAVTNGAGIATDPWATGYRTIRSADDILRNARGIAMDPGTRSGILALAYVIKAETLGELLQTYEKVSLDTYNNEQATFVDRATGLATVLALLDSARTTLAEQAPSAQFNSNILARGFDLQNTMYAYIARYQRIAGNYAAAIAAANQVNRGVFSVLPFDATTRNPFFVLVTTSSTSILPRDIFLDTAIVAGDTIRAFYHVARAATVGRLPTTLLDAYVRYASQTAGIPTYYPDEVLLIKAEAIVLSNGSLAEAQAVVDSVRRDCAATPTGTTIPVFGTVAGDPSACLPALPAGQTRAQLLAEIYRNRRFELYATGLRWEDLRRRGFVGAQSIAKRCWMPYPIGERNANPNASLQALPDPESTEPPANNQACAGVAVAVTLASAAPRHLTRLTP